jgi:hypothetical protein
MADFVQKANIKSAVRTLADPIADVAAFDAIVQSVIATNPFACVEYMTAGNIHAPVEKTRESYVAKLVYENVDAKNVGRASDTYNTMDGYTTGIAARLADATTSAAHGGTAVHDVANDTFSATLKCNDEGGEQFYVTFNRSQVVLSSYEDDAIRTKVETWADSVAALA